MVRNAVKRLFKILEEKRDDLSLDFYPPLHEKADWFRLSNCLPPENYVCLTCFNVVNYNRSRFCFKCGTEVDLNAHHTKDDIMSEIPRKKKERKVWVKQKLERVLERLIEGEKYYGERYLSKNKKFIKK